MIYDFASYARAAAPDLLPESELYRTILDAVVPYPCRKPKEAVILSRAQLFTADCRLVAARLASAGARPETSLIRSIALDASTVVSNAGDLDQAADGAAIKKVLNLLAPSR